MNTSKQKLNTVILRGMASTVGRMTPETLNEDGIKALQDLKVAIDDLIEAVKYEDLIGKLEDDSWVDYPVNLK